MLMSNEYLSATPTWQCNK